MRGVALGLQKSCNFIPPIRSVIDRVLELTEGHQAWYERRFLEHTMKTRDFYEPTVEVHLSLSDQYDWCSGKQGMFDQALSRMKLGDTWQCGLTQLLFDRDTSGPQQIFGSIAG